MSSPIETMGEIRVSPDCSQTPPQETLDAGVGEQVAFVDVGTTAGVENPAIHAMKELQRGLSREAERLGITTGEDAMAIVKELRGDYS